MLNGIIVLSILTILIQATIPFFKKEIFKEVDILIFMLVANIVIILILIFSCIYNYTFKDFKIQLSKLKKQNVLTLIIFLAICIMVINFLKNYIYSNSNINQSETLLITLSIVFTIFYGALFFNEKLTVEIGLGSFIILIGVIILFKKSN